jgi:hypothetical protein
VGLRLTGGVSLKIEYEMTSITFRPPGSPVLRLR